MPLITYDTTENRASDSQTVTARKLLQLTNAGGGGTGSVKSGTGAPVADPGVQSAIYYDLATGDLYEWNDSTGAWV